MFRDKPKFYIATLFWLTLCVACFCWGWLTNRNTDRPAQNYGKSGAVVRAKSNLVAISLGSVDGVKVGQRFGFFRKNLSQGIGVSTFVSQDKCVCRILEGEIRGGDSAFLILP